MNPQTTIDYGEYLLSLSDEEREQAGAALNQMLLAAAPDEEVGKPPVRSLGEYLDTEIDLPPMLVEPGIVARGAISALVSRGGKGKTALSLNRLIRWSMGKPLFDELPDLMAPTEGPLRILIIENEGNGGHFQQVLTTIINENDFTDDERALARENVYIWGDGGWSGLKMDRDEDLALVDRAVGEIEADIAFIEPFRGLWRGDENSSTDMANVLDRMSDIANRHACGIMLTHHERKSGAGEGPGADPMSAARGSGVLEAAAAVMERWLPVKAGRQRELSCIKNRFAEVYAPARMEYSRESWSYRYVTENENERAAKGVLAQFPGQWMTVADVAAAMDEDKGRVRKWLNALYDDDDQPVSRQPMGAGTHGYRLTGGGDDNDTGGIGI